jgi:hypothetical protein
VSFVHPETGVIMETREEFLAALKDIDARMAPLWAERRVLRNALADRFPPPEMPRPRERTATQEKVARCPRCGNALEREEAAE